MIYDQNAINFKKSLLLNTHTLLTTSDELLTSLKSFVLENMYVYKNFKKAADFLDQHKKHIPNEMKYHTYLKEHISIGK